MNISERIWEMARPLARAGGMELLDVAFVKEGSRRVLRLTVEKQDGPTSVADCESVSSAVGRALDATDSMPCQYVLEVSSAGLTRPLHGLEDCRKTVGSLVKITLRTGEGPYTGTLLEAGEQEFKIGMPDGSEIRIPAEDVAVARREVDFGLNAFRKGKKR